MKHSLIIASFVLIIVFFFLFSANNAQTTLKYFPFNEHIQFDQAKTTLSVTEVNQHPLLQWSVESLIGNNAFLRHDVSLLFQNGQLKGIQSKWNQNEPAIQQSTSLEPTGSQFFQSISVHYAEIHTTDQPITSQYRMTNASIYLIKDPFEPILAFEQPNTAQEQKWAETLAHTTEQQLDLYWTELIEHFSINRENYLEIPLITLIDFQAKPLFSKTQTETNKIIAQLWEGLYKYYILPFTINETISESFMPLILIDKNEEQLFVLFVNASGEKQQLKQTITN
ncbi:hypothetical protein SAMN04488134_101330 [Amphibacillus marinus]|uniref:Uncharacterized protein n=1 Tax=Amphibacillus marinus TaxID=872970 RepID=A0A1H8HG79_9BACI|nr:hypothetical protein [Amphibacillus marinus]SEN54887.1 hypothetical protein SAMN04488134_101330 [Amphibacillus marinus]